MYSITFAFKYIVLFMAIFASSLAAGQNINYYAFLPNIAGEIDPDGFQIGYHSIYTQWDLDGDGEISEAEFYKVIFQRLDNNEDNYLSKSEWARGEKYLFKPTVEDKSRNGDMKNSTTRQNFKNLSIKDLDSDKDRKLSMGEVDTGMRQNHFFQSFDSNQNGKLNRKELNNHLYKLMDLNNNGVIEKKEFETTQSLYID